MNFLPSNKYAAFFAFLAIVAVGVVLATTLIKIKPDLNESGSFKFSLAGAKKK